MSFFVILRNGSLHSFLACYIVFIVLCVFRFKKWELENWENGPVCLSPDRGHFVWSLKGYHHFYSINFVMIAHVFWASFAVMLL